MRQWKMFTLIQTFKNWVISHWPLLVSLIIPLIIVGSLARPGYILTYDMVFSPHVFLNIHTTLEGYTPYNAVLVQIILKVLSFLLPMDIVQKVILIGIFFLSIYGIYLLLPLKSKVARLLAGLMYGLNPFVYDRLMAGHWKFLLGYALTPFVVRIFWRLFQTPNRINATTAILAWVGVAVISSHHLLILGLLFITLAIAFVRNRQSTIAALATIFSVLFLSSWWLIPLILIPNTTQAFGTNDFYTFAAKPDTTYGIWLTLASLQGIWFQGWQPISHFISGQWPYLFAIWLIPVFIGIGITLSDKQRYVHRFILGLGGAAILSVLFVAGPSAGFGQLITWLFTHVPGLSGIRESQKLLSILALFYAVCAAYGFAVLASLSRRLLAWIILGISSLIIVTVGWPLLYGASHQLAVSQYPDDWQQLSNVLSKNHNEYALVLPYDLYINKSFAGRLVANPASVYFGDQAIISNDAELPSLHSFISSDDKPLSNAIHVHDLKKLQQELIRRRIYYIILINSDDLPEYLWINQLPHSVLARSEKSTVLRLTVP